MSLDEGFRLTFGGYDYLSLRYFSKRDAIAAVGNQIGVGKESDVYVVSAPNGEKRVLKIHRLGRISFRKIKEKRDYLRDRKASNWMYVSHLSAQTEYKFLEALYKHGFPVPTPIDHTRHCILMSLVNAYPLSQIREIKDPGGLYAQLVDLILLLARQGLIHGDFNEFNILYNDITGDITLIDFPQMVSIEHPNAKQMFDRDVDCIVTFLRRKSHFEPDSVPVWEDFTREGNLDVELGASGANGKLNMVLEGAREETLALSDSDGLEEEVEYEGEQAEEVEDNST